jgi:hypothetical protein
LARLRTLAKAALDPAPYRCFAPLLCVRGTSGAAPEQLPLVTGSQEEEAEEAEEEEEGLGGRMVSVGGPGPSGVGQSPPPSCPQAQGGALRLKPRREWDGVQLGSDWLWGPQGAPKVGPGGRPGPGEEGGACDGSEAPEGTSRCLVTGYGVWAPSLLWVQG